MAYRYNIFTGNFDIVRNIFLDNEDLYFGNDKDFNINFDSTDSRLTFSSGALTDFFSFNTQGVAIFSSLTNPTVVGGGMFYDGTNFYLGR